jgi:hypothetical protein
LFVDTDFYVFGGVGIVGLEERADVTSGKYTSCTASGNLSSAIPCFSDTVKLPAARASRVAIAPTFGAGLSLYLADFLTMSIEWRALPFAWNTSGSDESGSTRGDFPDHQINSSDHLSHFNHLLTLGFGFFVPTKPKISEVAD